LNEYPVDNPAPWPQESPPTDVPAQSETTTRAELVRRFEAWLDVALANEAPPEGVAAELLDEIGGDVETEVSDHDSGAPYDALALWSAMTALTQEVKLEGRAFKDLGVSLEPLRDVGARLDAVIGAHGAALEEARRIADHAHAQRLARNQEVRLEAQRETRGEMLAILLDLRERTVRGVQSARAHAATVEARFRPTWVMRALGKTKHIEDLRKAARAQEQGYLLCLERINDTLGSFGVRLIPCVGRRFDPARMKAVDIEETDAAPKGTVLEVYRAGYEWNGDVFRPAQVKVALPRRTAPNT